MRLVRGRTDARWLPSRHNAALFRLYAYLRLRNARPEHSNAVLTIDRHQSAMETWMVMSWVTLTFACYLAATLFAKWNVAIAVAVSIPLAVALMEVPPIVSALTIAPTANVLARGRADRMRINTWTTMCSFIGASAYLATKPTWVRFVAWQFLAVLVVNAIAAVIVFSLRGSIARLEAEFGGATSAP